jgi:predicted GIY-YIG superfamily endonuclease
MTHQMMENVGLRVDEIVSTKDLPRNVQYTYFHLKSKEREDKIGTAIHKLTSTHGLKLLNESGEGCINSSSIINSEFIETHPGFQLLLAHEISGDSNFQRWSAPSLRKSTKAMNGFNLLKSKLGIIHNAHIENKGIYVLRADNRTKPFFYVGKAENIERRIQQHADGTGAHCITGEPFTRVEPVTKGTTGAVQHAASSSADFFPSQEARTTWKAGSETRC